jgi:hypothetical protein
MKSTWFILGLVLAAGTTTVHGLSNRKLATTVTRGTSTNNSNKQKMPSATSPKREDLPTLDVPRGSLPVLEPPYPGISAQQFYPPTYTLLRAGPVSFLRRITSGKSYEQYVWKYMKDYRDDSLMSAQGNADAFLASAGT